MEMKQEIQQIMKESHALAGVDPLKNLYISVRDKAVTRLDMLQNDCTILYQKAKVDKLKRGEIWAERIRGEVRTGKSTVGFKEITDLNEIRFRLGLRAKRVNINSCVLSDQTEFVRLIAKRPRQCSVLIDEYNTLAEGGANASTEQQILQSYGDIFASDYVDRVNCNPTQIKDTNATVELIIMGKLPGFKTRCELVYCDNVDQEMQTLGYVDIYVGDIIKNWIEKVRPVFEQETRTEKEEQFIKEWANKDPYVKYCLKKENRQKLMTKHHVRDVRELEFAKIGIETYKQLVSIATGRTTKIPPSVIIETVKDVCQEQGAIYSYYAETIVVNKVSALLGLCQDIAKQEAKLYAPKLHSDARENIKHSIKQVSKLLNKRLTNDARNCGLYQEYLKIQ